MILLSIIVLFVIIFTKEKVRRVVPPGNHRYDSSCNNVSSHPESDYVTKTKLEVTIRTVSCFRKYFSFF